MEKIDKVIKMLEEIKSKNQTDDDSSSHTSYFTLGIETGIQSAINIINRELKDNKSIN